jgi:hypothetical protein
MEKKIVVVASLLFCVVALQGMNTSKKVVIKDSKDFDKIVQAREMYKKSNNVGMTDVTRGNKINYDPTRSSDTKKQDTAKKEEI